MLAARCAEGTTAPPLTEPSAPPTVRRPAAGGVTDYGAGDGHALTFTAGQFAVEARSSIAEAEPERHARDLRCLAATPSSPTERDVLHRRESGQ
jgi:hypothetical protein